MRYRNSAGGRGEARFPCKVFGDQPELSLPNPPNSPRSPRIKICARYVEEIRCGVDRAARHLVGSHDFLAFSEEVEPTANAIRELFEVTVKRTGREVWIDITGNAFMRGMMRRISGGLYEVGRGKRSVEDFGRLLDLKHRDQLMWPVVLPAKGLCLLKIKYGRHPKDFRERYQTISQETGHEQNIQRN